MTYQAQIEAIRKRIDIGISQGTRATLFSVCTKIIKETPVDTGRAKNNWFATIGHDTDRTTTYVDKSRFGNIGQRSSDHILEVTSAAPGSVFYLTNNLPYIADLEFNGLSKQGSHMATRNMQQFKPLLAKNLKTALNKV